MALPETGTPFHSFPFAASPLLTLAGGSQGTRGAGGALVNHELPNQESADMSALHITLNGLMWCVF